MGLGCRGWGAGVMVGPVDFGFQCCVADPRTCRSLTFLDLGLALL